MIGIYVIKNMVNGKEYVGSSIGLSNRKRQHFQALRGNRHKNKKLQNSYNKHGRDSFEFFEIEYCDRNVLEESEQFWIDQKKPFYNNAMRVERSDVKMRDADGVAAYNESGELVMSFDSFVEMTEKTRIARSNVLSTLRANKRHKKAGGYYWRKFIGAPENKITVIRPYEDAKHKKEVVCLNDGIFYNSITEAAAAYGIKKGSAVSRVCSGERSHVKGKKFEYV